VIIWIVSATGNVPIANANANANARGRQRVTKLMKMSEKLHLFYTI